jgi:SAM-dependent methyltransferase
MTTAYQSTRLSFRSLEDYQAFQKRNPRLFDQVWRWQMLFGDRPEPFTFHGICEACDKLVAFESGPIKESPVPITKHFVQWRHGARCPSCGLVSLDRFVLRVLDETHVQGQTIYHVGHFSPFRQWLSKHYAGVTSSQYEDGRKPGEIADGVRYEDLTQLSFDGRATNYVIAMEVLEHIPDYRAAMKEMARVLRRGGRALLSFPWLGLENYEHQVRAEVVNGEIVHLMEPEYHGDPAKKGGILSFRSFGWKVLDELREAGFSNATAEYAFAPVHGYMALQPIFVATR